MDRIGVREARQNLSVYLDRVKAGEKLTITEHGRPVAVLVPVIDDEDPYAELVAAGEMEPPKPPLGHLELPLPVPGALSVAQLLDELGEDKV